MNIIKGIVNKVASRKLAVTAVAGAAAATGAIELTWPMAVVTRAVEITLPVAIVAAAYIIGQGLVDTWGD